MKREPLETVVEAVRTVAGSGEWYSQEVMCKVMAWARGERPGLLARLTGRELEVLRLVARGWDNRRIMTGYADYVSIRCVLVEVFE